MSRRNDKRSAPASSPTAAEVRQKFLDYFAGRDHTIVPSSSLIPRDDPTILFTNAGMNQFKEVFLGHEERPYKRAATSQKCMRVSGKHNDLENVGPSHYHHTFFEMLGNFSFGDYFKAEAIEMAWELLTVEYGLPGERLWVSVFEEDDEAFELWQSVVGLPAERIARFGTKDNYWSMGDTGPCGPCSELHFDYGEGDGLWPNGTYGEPAELDLDADRFIEVWNLVFMQFNADGSGEVAPLPAPNIDTGAGLERLAAILQGHRSNYDTDLFRPLIDLVAGKSGRGYGEDDDADVALRVIADHSRATAFLLADSVSPANEGRGYVLRRLIRRAVRFGMKLGFDGPFMHEAAGEVVAGMGDVFPELRQAEELIVRVTTAEENRFFRALSVGTQQFDEVVARVKAEGGDTIPGDDAFRLYDTYGLPLELTREFAEDHGLSVDDRGFEAAMEGQRSRARAAWKGGADAAAAQRLVKKLTEKGFESTEFVGYDLLRVDGSEAEGLLRDDSQDVELLKAGEQGGLIVDTTPFYSESGGQVGDTGTVSAAGMAARVIDTQRLPGGLVLHSVEVEEGSLRVGDKVEMEVDAERRSHTIRNHTATHLLHAALREQLGEHVRQAGSLVAPDRLRFDFSHYEQVEPGEIVELERQVNEAIRADIDTEIGEMTYTEAIEQGALAFFGDKYGDRVRVVKVPGVSMELCGGTHVEATGEIGAFMITKEESVAAGTRRIEAVTGAAAIEATQHRRGVLRQVMARLQSTEDDLAGHIETLVAKLKSAERENEELRVRLASERDPVDVDSEGVEVEGVRVVHREVKGLDPGGLRSLADQLKAQLGSGVIVLGARHDGKAQLIVAVTADVADRVSAKNVVASLAEIVGGGGGGHREMAQAGGPAAEKLAEALERAPQVVAELLG